MLSQRPRDAQWDEHGPYWPWDEEPMTLRERLSLWLAYRRHELLCLACRVVGHDWCEWDVLPEGPGGRPLDYRVCNRCSSVEERDHAG